MQARKGRIGLWTAILLIASAAHADRVELQDGTVWEGVYLRDDGLRYLVWERLEQVGHAPDHILPRSRVRSVEIQRGEDWDAHPPLPDLTVTFIELNPKLSGLHGRVHYDRFGRPRIGGAPALVELPEERAFLEPERIVQDLKLQYDPGERITLTAHVKNVGFAPAGPFRYAWELDGQTLSEGTFPGTLEEMEETTFTLQWEWKAGEHWIAFRVESDEPEIATLNNVAKDPLWGWGLVYVTHPKRLELWHQNRTAYGTFSFEDFYRWHLEIMNALFEASRYPSTPEGVRARVRLDRIVVTEAVEPLLSGGFAEDGIRYDQGRWLWIDDGDRKGQWQPPTKEWRNQTEWSLPHELGHQLGLVDLYRLDYAGDETHRWPDNGKPITHFFTRPFTMMHWHGPHLWSEVHAAYLDRTLEPPARPLRGLLLCCPGAQRAVNPGHQRPTGSRGPGADLSARRPDRHGTAPDGD
ncbi:MAG: hypothetical protein KatS3mg115_0747 [Candidatus Poribacteria bacterium]|nr:MAG: hypothetical protein KatS3mg115_0747 [Candidatus Poribacteria bacterium]